MTPKTEQSIEQAAEKVAAKIPFATTEFYQKKKLIVAFGKQQHKEGYAKGRQDALRKAEALLEDRLERGQCEDWKPQLYEVLDDIKRLREEEVQ